MYIHPGIEWDQTCNQKRCYVLSSIITHLDKEISDRVQTYETKVLLDQARRTESLCYRSDNQLAYIK